jgi:hypothetical protein
MLEAWTESLNTFSLIPGGVGLVGFAIDIFKSSLIPMFVTLLLGEDGNLTLSTDVGILRKGALISIPLSTDSS